MMKCDVLSAIDKLKIFNNLEIPKNTLSAYIGDSETDLPCLSNIGIIMGNNRSLTKTCEKFGIEINEGINKIQST
ncbi:12641_t:CDS:2, partial [Entrophospora sp. SA101]